MKLFSLILLVACLTALASASIFSSLGGRVYGDGAAFEMMEYISVDVRPLLESREGDTVSFTLFDQEVFAVTARDLETVGDDDLAWNGILDEFNYASATIVLHADGTASGSIANDEAIYKVSTGLDGMHVMEKLSVNAPFPDAEPVVFDEEDDYYNDDDDNVAMDTLADGADVLCLYTSAVTNGEKICALAIAETNQAYATSGVRVKVNLVKAALVNYTEVKGASLGSRLNDLRGGKVAKAHELREQYKADFVALIVNDGAGYCGIASLMRTASVNFANSAFSVTAAGCATGYYSFGHELGHNQGLHHDPATARSNGVFAYGHGHRDPSRAFRTMMAYNCPNGGCRRMQFLSNPAKKYNGKVTGTSDTSNNARALNDVANIIVNFRKKKAAPPPPPPCKDIYTHCASWKRSNYCPGKYKSFMGDFCKKSCGKC